MGGGAGDPGGGVAGRPPPPRVEGSACGLRRSFSPCPPDCRRRPGCRTPGEAFWSTSGSPFAPETRVRAVACDGSTRFIVVLLDRTARARWVGRMAAGMDRQRLAGLTLEYCVTDGDGTDDPPSFCWAPVLVP